MRHSAALSLLATLLAAPFALPAQAAASAAAPAAAPVAPEVGQPAPGFTASLVDAAAGTAGPVSLAGLRGKVVVLAFYPRNRTSGCTAELTRFRDEHARLFGGEVVLLPVSADSEASHAAWGREMKFPFGLVSDPSLALADAYGSRTPGRATPNRTIFVIGKDGRIAYREMKFSALSEDAYSQLALAVAAAAKQ
ncbi:MAG: alkyl hydroperoxide reductase/Thiol specific antioxidant/Mal allergen [Gemmatimonadetes bacterium]|jgi:peroxiredoxin Q/BCP|nr:alkyl hydroperoxide reductase/Thiol specific antioxidant/Mal allergen [Gemmatimonadota bacterium]